MAEGTLKRESMAVPVRKKGLTRRDALAVIGGVAAGALIGERITRPQTESELVLKDQPKAIHRGITEIALKDENLNFRVENTTKSTNIPGERIIEVYGVKVQGKDKFTIENTLILDGQNADTLDEKGGDWIALKAKYQNALGLIVYDYLYVSRSMQTQDVVKPNYGVGKDLEVSSVKDGQYILKDGTPFQGKIGIVRLPETYK